jgi:hypothetical protein
MSRRERMKHDLEALAEKYRELVRLRVRREELEGMGRRGFDDHEKAERLEDFRRVAREFPGALRELDATPAPVLRRKLRAVEDELASFATDPARDAPGRYWVAIVLDYHRLLRDALADKLWLARRLGRAGVLGDTDLEEFLAWRALREDAWPWRTHTPGRGYVDALRRPPKGRIHVLIWRELAAHHDLDPDSIAVAVFSLDVL